MRQGLLFSILLMAMVCGTVWAVDGDMGGGNGSEGNPYLIEDLDDFDEFAGNSAYWASRVYTQLMTDISLSGRTYTTAVVAPDSSTSYGYQGPEFTGFFYGNGYVISNLTITALSQDWVGLFGYVGVNGRIEYLGVENVDVQARTYVGGLVGYNKKGIITNCYSTGSVQGIASQVGQTGYYVGGLVGYNDYSTTITRCYSQCSVSGIDYVGGLAGKSNTSLTYCYSTGSINGEDYIGGLVGANNSTIAYCYSSGSVSGSNYVGGLSGSGGGKISNCYSTSSVAGTSYVGGLIGKKNTNSINKCYSAGWVSGITDVGGLVGYSTGITVNSFWDIDVSGQTTSSGGVGKTTVEMKDMQTYLDADWWFIYGNMIEGDWILPDNDYPKHMWEVYSSVEIPDLKGLTEQEARVALDSAGLVVGQTFSVYDDSISTGFVSGTYPAFGAVIYKGLSPVHLLLSKHTKYAGGDGIRTPYVIENVDNFFELINSSSDWNKSFILEADINLDGLSFTESPIAPDLETGLGFSFGKTFNGIFDGNGYAISNLTITAYYEYYIGLFGMIGVDGQIRNLGTENLDVHGAASVGGLAGYSYGTITNCYSSGLIAGSVYWTGGLVGRIEKGVISNSYSTSLVKGSDHVGGLVGQHLYGNITNCHSTGSVSGSNGIGGLVGLNWLSTIANCYSTGLVSGSGNVGGLVGQNQDDAVISSFWDIETSGQATSVGGTGKTTSEMQTLSTFMSAGWDFTNETDNGTCNHWHMSQEGGYPALGFFSGIIPFELAGSGTEEDPYLVTDVNDLGTIWYRNTACYEMVNDIDLSDIQYNIAVIPVFSGYLDGKGFRIFDLSIEGGSNLGLFGEMTLGSEVRNIGIENINIQASGFYVGGLVGYNKGGTALNCYTTGLVNGAGYTGGLAGSYNGIAKKCYSTVSVSGSDIVGGLMGCNYDTATDCYSVGSVNGDSNVGGLVGIQYSSLVLNSYSTGAVSGTGTKVGGLVGYNRYGTTTNCYSTGSVNGSDYIGGLVGYNEYELIMNCYSTGYVSGTFNIGGLVGYNSGEVRSSFWDIDVSGQMISYGGIGKTTDEMQIRSTFTDKGWDFLGESGNGENDIWRMCVDGVEYPRLSWEFSNNGDFACGDGTDIFDLQALAEHWLLTEATNPTTFSYSCDANGDGVIDMADYSVLGSNW